MINLTQQDESILIRCADVIGESVEALAALAMDQPVATREKVAEALEASGASRYDVVDAERVLASIMLPDIRNVSWASHPDADIQSATIRHESISYGEIASVVESCKKSPHEIVKWYCLSCLYLVYDCFLPPRVIRDMHSGCFSSVGDWVWACSPGGNYAISFRAYHYCINLDLAINKIIQDRKYFLPSSTSLLFDGTCEKATTSDIEAAIEYAGKLAGIKLSSNSLVRSSVCDKINAGMNMDNVAMLASTFVNERNPSVDISPLYGISYIDKIIMGAICNG